MLFHLFSISSSYFSMKLLLNHFSKGFVKSKFFVARLYYPNFNLEILY